jgi:response regulator RpfG family c-di-GMP phosphodiesterase/GGDEF domain-containing protein
VEERLSAACNTSAHRPSCAALCDVVCRHEPCSGFLTPAIFEQAVRERLAADTLCASPPMLLTIALDRRTSLDATFGPEVWEQAQEQLGHVLATLCGPDDILAHLRPHTFGLLTSETAAAGTLAAIQDRLRHCNTSGSLPVVLGIKWGQAAHRGHSYAELLALAEAAMGGDAADESGRDAGGLPVSPAHIRSLPQADSARRAAILILSNDPSTATFLQACLEDTGARFLVTDAIEPALAGLREHPADAVIAGMDLPRVDGLDFLQRVRRVDPSIPVILYTARRDVRLAVLALRGGADDFLVQPFAPDDVRDSLARGTVKRRLALGGRAQQAALEAQVQRRAEELQQVIRHLEVTYRTTLKALGAALDTRDVETHAHSERVAQYALTLGHTLGMGPSELVTLERGVYLHDIGKIGIPDRVLLKQGSLTEEEWDIMRRHSELGHRLASRIDFLKGASKIILAHHERYDGRGYPFQLAREAIPFGARVFSIVDALDAITSDRPYRKAKPFGTAMDEIRINSGRQFDPAITDAFLSVPESTWSRIRETVNQQAAEQSSEPLIPKSLIMASGG